MQPYTEEPVEQTIEADTTDRSDSQSSASDLPDSDEPPGDDDHSALSTLIAAAESGDLERLRMLLEHEGQSAHQRDAEDGWTLLHWVAFGGHEPVVRYLTRPVVRRKLLPAGRASVPSLPTYAE